MTGIAKDEEREQKLMANKVEFDDIVRHLRNTGWEFRITGSNALTSNVRGDRGVYLLIVAFQRGHDIIRIVAQLRDRIPEVRADAMLRLAAHINWGQGVAACDYDPRSGIVRFRGALTVDNGPFEAGRFSSVLAAVFTLAEQSVPAIDGVRTGRLTIEAAIAKADEHAGNLRSPD